MDVARLGFEVDTSDLTTAEKSLEKLVPVAAKAEVAADKLVNSFTGLSGGANKFAADLNKSSSGAEKFSKSSLASSTSVGAMAAATTSASAKMTNLDTATRAAVLSTGAFSSALDSVENDLNQAAAATNKMASANDNLEKSVKRSGAAARKSADDTSKSMRAIGATAGQMQSNTTNLIAQFQDIGVTAAMGMNPMLIGMQQGAQIAAVMQNAVGQQGLGGALKQLGGSFLSVLGPVTFLSIAFTGLLAAAVQFINWTSIAKGALNLLADGLTSLADGLAFTGEVLLVVFGPVALVGVVALTKAIAVGLVGAIGSAIKAMVVFSMTNPFTALMIGLAAALTAIYHYRDEFAQIFGVDIIKVIKDTADTMARLMIAAYNTVRRVWEDLPNIVHDAWQQAKAYLNDLVVVTNTQTGETKRLFNFDIQAERGALANAGKVFSEEMAKVAKFSFSNTLVAGFKSAADSVRKFASGLGVEDGKKDKDTSDKEKKEKYSSELEVMRLQNQMYLDDLIMSGNTLTTELSNTSKAVFQSIINNARTSIKEVFNEMNEISQFSRVMVGDMFKSFRDNLMQGKTLWDSFADTAMRAIGRISDKLIDMWLDVAMKGEGGGLFGSIVSAIGGLFKNAKGNAFGPSGVVPFANGGIVDSPTMFGFAGGKTGLMGEAGTEGILPLKRGTDGKLGVIAHGGGGSNGSSVTLHVVGEEGPMFRPTIKAVAHDEAVNVTTAGMDAFNEALPDRMQQIAGDERLR